jgi:hypothetical protein
MERQSDRADRNGLPTSSHLSLETIAARLTSLDAGQAAMNGALGLMLDTLHVQITLLRKLSEFAAEDSAPSPLLKTLQGLTAAIMELDASVGDVARPLACRSATIRPITKDRNGPTIRPRMVRAIEC